MMDEKTEKIIAQYLENSQDRANQQALEMALETQQADAGAVADLLAFNARLEAMPLPEPSPAMRTDFYRMLAAEKQKQQGKTSWLHWLSQWSQLLPLSRLAYSLLLLALGGVLGLWYQRDQGPETEKLVALTAEMQEMKQMMMLTLLKQPSATDRLKAVNLTTDLTTANSKVIQALLQTLNNDPNVNVRLAAIEALYQHADNPVARAGLVQSIGQQDSPLVQLALADIMLAMQEKESVKQLKQLLKKENLNEAVKTKVEKTIKVLI